LQRWLLSSSNNSNNRTSEDLHFIRHSRRQSCSLIQVLIRLILPSSISTNSQLTPAPIQHLASPRSLLTLNLISSRNKGKLPRRRRSIELPLLSELPHLSAAMKSRVNDLPNLNLPKSLRPLIPHRIIIPPHLHLLPYPPTRRPRRLQTSTNTPICSLDVRTPHPLLNPSPWHPLHHLERTPSPLLPLHHR
jgi:hypothetical protein